MHDAKLDMVRRYLDNGATSFPKPTQVAQAMIRYLNEVGGPYGRAAYPQAYEASSIVFRARENASRLLGVSDSSRVVLTQNATHGLNIAIQRGIAPGSTVLVSPLEHNAVMRPLFMMKEKMGVNYQVMPHGGDGRINVDEMVVDSSVSGAIVNMQSNVNGVIQPVAAIKKRLGDIPLIVDAAQAAGEVPILSEERDLDMVACTGHKHLLGPTGTGFLYVKKGLSLAPLLPGGTGSSSAEFAHPDAMPDLLEGGTPNIVGLAGLDAALSYLDTAGPGPARSLVKQAIEELETMKSVTIYRALDWQNQGGTFSLNIDGLSSSETGALLNDRFGIAVRAGLHCSPLAHQSLGTFAEGGTVRVCFGHFQGPDSVELLVSSVAQIVRAL